MGADRQLRMCGKEEGPKRSLHRKGAGAGERRGPLRVKEGRSQDDGASAGGQTLVFLMRSDPEPKDGRRSWPLCVTPSPCGLAIGLWVGFCHWGHTFALRSLVIGVTPSFFGHWGHTFIGVIGVTPSFFVGHWGHTFVLRCTTTPSTRGRRCGSGSHRGHTFDVRRRGLKMGLHRGHTFDVVGGG